jgi:hypothetical protein
MQQYEDKQPIINKQSKPDVNVQGGPTPSDTPLHEDKGPFFKPLLSRLFGTGSDRATRIRFHITAISLSLSIIINIICKKFNIMARNIRSRSFAVVCNTCNNENSSQLP